MEIVFPQKPSPIDPSTLDNGGSGWQMIVATVAVGVLLIGLAWVALSDGEEEASVFDEPLMAGAELIEADQIAPGDLLATIDPRPGDALWSAVVREGDGRRVLVRLRPGTAPHIYATSCAVLVLVELPEGWEGTCLEFHLDGMVDTGVFPYAEAAARLEEGGEA